MRKIVISILSLIIALCIFASCGKSIVKNDSNSDIPDDIKNPVVTIEMENGEKIELELFAKDAPNTVKNFISLINKGFYDGTIFHRIIPGFVIQGGDPEGNGFGGPGYCIKGEFINNGFDNQQKHLRGALSMARSGRSNDTAGSQFFICVADRPDLDNSYAVFGNVISGMETVDKIVAVERDAADKPIEDQIMKKVTVNTFGYEFPEPETIAE